MQDIETFFIACEQGDAVILGWEVWIVDHDADLSSGSPVFEIGQWCGLIPVITTSVPAVIGGGLVSGRRESEPWAELVGRSVAMARDQIAEAKLAEEVVPDWQPFLRVNFTFQLESEG
ncbi:hypothetical protein BWR60_07030 [Inquilinus limosus]|uniref:Uncharacterized protein n=1 Tax=Inquilinus limosus TaxID=171674 RepID=A0A211ZRQ9_9PROT|nr:hypothetical protein BWR60_07030 [Inquilinus limosus]